MTIDKTKRAKGKLQESKSKLDTLLNITNLINENAPSKELFQILESVLIVELKIGKFVLFTKRDNQWVSSLYQGIAQDDCDKIDIKTLILLYSDIGIISEDDSTECSAEFDLIIPVYHKENPVAYMVLADSEGEKIEISPIIKHLRFIQTLINIIVVALENKRLNKEQLKQIAIKKELELAHNMQSLLFPNSLPNDENLIAKALYLPHSEVGGDYYDVVPLSNNKMLLCIADVSGKGMSAALLMANFQANLRALVNVADNIEELIRMCNRKIIESASYQKFITLFVCIFDPENRTLQYVNAGHQPALLFNDEEIRSLKTGTTVLGMFDELPALSSETIDLKSNSTLVCFTDGLTELTNKKGEQLESEGIKEIIKDQKNLNGILAKVKSKIRTLEDLSGLDDDITLLAAQFLPE